MEEKNIQTYEVKKVETFNYSDGSKKTIENFQVFGDNMNLPDFVYKQVDYWDENGIYDKDKSFGFRETACIVNDETSQEDNVSFSDSGSESESESKDTECQTTP